MVADCLHRSGQVCDSRWGCAVVAPVGDPLELRGGRSEWEEMLFLSGRSRHLGGEAMRTNNHVLLIVLIGVPGGERKC